MILFKYLFRSRRAQLQQRFVPGFHSTPYALPFSFCALPARFVHIYRVVQPQPLHKPQRLQSARTLLS